VVVGGEDDALVAGEEVRSPRRAAEVGHLFAVRAVGVAHVQVEHVRASNQALMARFSRDHIEALIGKAAAELLAELV